MFTPTIKEVAPTDFAEQIYTIMQEAYSVEAKLLGVNDFFPLGRTARDIADSDNLFLGYSHGGELIGVCEVEDLGNHAGLIAATVVNPNYFRRGIASSLIGHLLASTFFRTFTVSTAEGNLPAIKLYQAHGFKPVGRKTLPDGMRVVTLRFLT